MFLFGNVLFYLFLFQGVIGLVLDCIDRLHLYSSASHFAAAAGKEAGDDWENILNSFYELLGENDPLSIKYSV
jgi:hypothetical protein